LLGAPKQLPETPFFWKHHGTLLLLPARSDEGDQLGGERRR
jgi:hypothetical protein